MTDNPSYASNRKWHRDLLHSLILLGTVPLLFFASLCLIKKPDEISPNQDGPTENKLSWPFVAKKSPPPGEAWLSEVAKQEQRVEQLRSRPNAPPERIKQLQQRLAILRGHLEQHLDAVPRQLQPNHPLSAALLRLVTEIDQTNDSASSRTTPLDWKQEFSALDSKERAHNAAELARAEKQLVTPLEEKHRAKLAAIQRESRDIEDQIQTARNKQSDIQRRTERELARQTRLQAFDVDRAEIHRLLSPFIARDNMVLGKNARDWIRAPEAQPLSWRSLESFGALQPTMAGLQTLSHIGCQANLYPKTPRPLGSFPFPNSGELKNPHEIELTKRAQHLLKVHAQTLIEEGLLAP